MIAGNDTSGHPDRRWRESGHELDRQRRPGQLHWRRRRRHDGPGQPAAWRAHRHQRRRQPDRRHGRWRRATSSPTTSYGA
ncbi:MAG: hypothetical protein MZV64_19950 [Ignavibacteriales bacterium]|nr:hypothetical protein [Ignavibacteriales bacterium]